MQSLRKLMGHSDGTRPDRPRLNDKGEPVKYESPRGRRCPAYFPQYTRSVIGRVDVPLVITEGAKKAAAVDQLEIACVGISGVDGWQGDRGPDDKPRLAREIAVSSAPSGRSVRSDLLAVLQAVGAEFVRRYYPDANMASFSVSSYAPRGGRAEYHASIPVPVAKAGT
jgi:hypothetical protein